LVFFDSFSLDSIDPPSARDSVPSTTEVDKEGGAVKKGMRVGYPSAVFPLISTEMKSQSRIGAGAFDRTCSHNLSVLPLSLSQSRKTPTPHRYIEPRLDTHPHSYTIDLATLLIIYLQDCKKKQPLTSSPHRQSRTGQCLSPETSTREGQNSTARRKPRQCRPHYTRPSHSTTATFSSK
jgi:hypothetical protein